MSETPDQFTQWLAGRDVEPLPPPPGTFDRIRRSARRTRLARGAAAAVGVLAVAAAVQVTVRAVATPGGYQVTGAPGSAASAPGVAGGQGASGSGSAGQSGGPGPGAAPGATSPGTGQSATGAAPSGSTGRCRTAQLRVTVEPSDSEAGHIGLSIRFGNTASAPCTLTGYPGVSFVAEGSGQQVNDPAQRAAGGRVATVTLPPGGSARAPLQLVEPGNYPAEACVPVRVAGFRIYPPGETVPVVAPSPQPACSVPGAGVPEIYPVQPG